MDTKDKTMAAISFVLIGLVGIVAYAALGADKITIDSKHWRCTAARPIGIKSECTILEMKDLGGR